MFQLRKTSLAYNVKEFVGEKNGAENGQIDYKSIFLCYNTFINGDLFHI